MVKEEHGKKKRITVSFDCETLKAEKAAEDHIKHFIPKLAGLDAVGMFYLLSFSRVIIFLFYVELSQVF